MSVFINAEKQKNFSSGFKDGFDKFMNTIEDSLEESGYVNYGRSFIRRYARENLIGATKQYRKGFIQGSYMCLEKHLENEQEQFFSESIK